MTCKDIDPVDTRPRTNNSRLKKGPKMKRKASSRKNRNSLYFKSCSMTSGPNTKIVEGNDSTQNLVETEFRILQSLIPGISEKNEISEVREDIFKITKSIFHINNFDESIISLVFFFIFVARDHWCLRSIHWNPTRSAWRPFGSEPTFEYAIPRFYAKRQE